MVYKYNSLHSVSVHSLDLHTATFEMKLKLKHNMKERSREKLCDCYKGKIIVRILIAIHYKKVFFKILSAFFHQAEKLFYPSIKTT